MQKAMGYLIKGLIIIIGVFLIINNCVILHKNKSNNNNNNNNNNDNDFIIINDESNSKIRVNRELMVHNGKFNNNNENKNNKRTKRELIAYLHGGPGKTGTTHIQSTVVQNEKSLLMANLAIWPDFASSIKRCFSDGLLNTNLQVGSHSRVKQLSFFFMNCNECVYLQHAFSEFVKESAKSNRKIFLSSEIMLFKRNSLDTVIKLLMSHGYMIHGIMTYRFQLSWTLSLYKEWTSYNSIASKEKQPSIQQMHSLLSEFLKEEWNDSFGLGPIYFFHDMLMNYSNSKFSVVDYYGVEALEKPFSYVFLCEIMGVFCHSDMHSNIKTSHATHMSEEEGDIIEKQMIFVFANYAENNNCSLDFQTIHSDTRKFVATLARKYEWGKSAPRRNVDLSRYAKLAVENDKRLREKLGVFLLNANETANLHIADILLTVDEVDQDSMYHDKSWISILNEAVSEVKTKGLCLQRRE